jgi:hypothetical protein
MGRRTQTMITKFKKPGSSCSKQGHFQDISSVFPGISNSLVEKEKGVSIESEEFHLSCWYGIANMVRL